MIIFNDVLLFGTILITVIRFQFDVPLGRFPIPRTGYIVAIQDAIGVDAFVVMIFYSICPINEPLDLPLQRNGWV